MSTRSCLGTPNLYKKNKIKKSLHVQLFKNKHIHFSLFTTYALQNGVSWSTICFHCRKTQCKCPCKQSQAPILERNIYKLMYFKL